MQIFCRRSWLLTGLVLAALLGFAPSSQQSVFAAQTENVSIQEDWNRQIDLRSSVREAGTLRVIVELNIKVQPEGRLRTPEDKQSQRAAIRTAQNSLVSEMQGTAGVSFLTEFETLPLVVFEVDEAGLTSLESRKDIKLIVEDEISAPSLSSALPVIGAPEFNAAGYDGSGQVVAILDTGVDVTHDAFTTGRNRIVAEGCFSTESATYGGVHTVCPGGVEESTAPGSADDCVSAVNSLGISGAITDCKHGTHVAGIVGANDGDTMFGVAPDVDLVPVQVFSAFDAYGRMLSFTSDQIKGLEYILELKEELNIVAVNMSLGGNYNSSSCDYDARRQAILNLQSVGVATIIAAGNEGYKDGIGQPSCISEAIAVGSSNDNDTISSFSNVSNQIDLLAPGNSITSTFPGNSRGNMSGTSMATPMVAGAWALISESNPDLSVDEKLALLKNSGKKVSDDRASGIVTNMARLDLAAALDEMQGTVDVKINTEPVFFSNQSETIAVSVSNSGDLEQTGYTLALEFPTELSPITTSISDSGQIIGQEIVWENISISGDETKTFTFNAATANPGSMILAASLSDSVEVVDSAETSLSARDLSACNVYESFESGWMLNAEGWNENNQPDGRINQSNSYSHTGDGSLILDDTSLNGILNRASVEITIPTDNSEFQLLDFYWQGVGYYSTYTDTGLFLSFDRGLTWEQHAEINEKGVWEHITIDLAQVSATAGPNLADSVVIKFQFMGDGNIDHTSPSLSTGLIIDDLQINCGGSLTWDGEGESNAWSDPMNWSPNLTPNGHTVLFDSNSPAASEIDSAFTNSIHDLVITAGWMGTLTQTAPLTLTGDLLQQGGLVILDSSDSLTVDGDVILKDGAIRQTKYVQNESQVFLKISNASGSSIKHGGYQLAPTEALSEPQEVMVTMAGPVWGNTYCEGFSNQSSTEVNRCFNINSLSESPLSTRIWLDDSEINSTSSDVNSIVEEFEQMRSVEGTNSGEGVSLTSEMIKLQGFIDGTWSDLEIAQMGAADGRLYVEVDLDAPVPVLAQKMSRTPTAVTLSAIGAMNPFSFFDQLNWLLITWFSLMILSLAVLILRSKADQSA